MLGGAPAPQQPCSGWRKAAAALLCPLPEGQALVPLPATAPHEGRLAPQKEARGRTQDGPNHWLLWGALRGGNNGLER